MEKSKIFEASTLEVCIKEAAAYFKVKPDNIGYHILEKRDSPTDIAYERTFFRISAFILTPTLKKVGRLLDSTMNDVFESIADIPDIDSELKQKIMLEQQLEAENQAEKKKMDERFKGFSEDVAGIFCREENDGFVLKDRSNPDTELYLHATLDGMKLKCSKSKGAVSFSLEKMTLFLGGKGFVFGVKKDVLGEFLKTVEETSDVVIAEGIQRIDGKEAKLDFHESFNDSHKYYNESGNFDFRSLCYAKNIKEGEKILEIIPPTQGRDGKDIYGNTVVAYKPEEVTITAGENVRTSSGDKGAIEYWAEITGNITFNEDVLAVSQVIYIKGDVDYNVGNLDFDGCIVVEGNILDNFRVKCTRDLTVKKNIRAAFVKCDGNVFVSGGIISKDKGELDCDGNLKARYIDSGKIFVEGNIDVEKEIMHSTVYTNSMLTCKNGIGKIIGGTIRALDGIDCRILGSSYGILTEIFLGDDFSVKRYAEVIKPKIEEIKSKLVKLDQMKKRFKKLIVEVSDLPETMRDKLNILYSQEKELKKKMFVYLTKLEKKQKESKKNLDAELIIRNRIYPPIVINFNNKVHELTRPYNASRIFYSKKKNMIMIKPLTK